jgi:hypothetical protein
VRGSLEASLNPTTDGDAHRGLTCAECGLNGWSRKCGRCGHESQVTPRDGE